MDPRYIVPQISTLWSLENRLAGWQRTELACVQADFELGSTPAEAARDICQILAENFIDLDFYKAKDKELRHDLNAFLAERERYLPAHLHQYFHREMTSYDTQEPAMAIRLQASTKVVMEALDRLEAALRAKVIKYQFTPMMARTHGQGAELQTFGVRCGRYLVMLGLARQHLEFAKTFLRYSKISGAVGNYTGRTMEEEKRALELLGLEPFYGASQIMPRLIYLPLVSAMQAVGNVLGQIALDIRLGARSGCPICQEFFAATQMGSSAMPHKRNTINTEGLDGLLALLFGDLLSLELVMKTWEERAIEQSSTERVAWPDAFHALVYCIDRMATVLEKLRVYPDNMMQEIKDMRGCYATSAVKTLLKKLGAPHGLTSDDAYRIVQLAAFNVIPIPDADSEPPSSLEEAEERFAAFMAREETPTGPQHIRDVIQEGALEASTVLETDPDQLKRWNAALKTIFSEEGNCQELAKTFTLKRHLMGESLLYEKVLGTAA